MKIADLPSELLVAVLAKTSTVIILRCTRVSTGSFGRFPFTDLFPPYRTRFANILGSSLQIQSFCSTLLSSVGLDTSTTKRQLYTWERNYAD